MSQMQAQLNGLINSASGPATQPAVDPFSLPGGQLESLRFKAQQIVESIQTLQRTIEVGGQAAMPPWPELLSKYNVLLSQTHSLSASLLARAPGAAATAGAGDARALERISLHPRGAMSDGQLDNELIPLLRNQQTTDVLRLENDTVRRLAAHMSTRGSVGVLGVGPSVGPGAPVVPVDVGGARDAKKPEYEDVIRECAEIRAEHDRRVERAVRAVTMLRDKYDWKPRVEVDQEEPEELDWDPRIQPNAPGIDVPDDVGGDVEMDTPGGESSDEDLENIIGAPSPASSADGGATPMED